MEADSLAQSVEMSAVPWPLLKLCFSVISNLLKAVLLSETAREDLRNHLESEMSEPVCTYTQIIMQCCFFLSENRFDLDTWPTDTKTTTSASSVNNHYVIRLWHHYCFLHFTLIDSNISLLISFQNSKPCDVNRNHSCSLCWLTKYSSCLQNEVHIIFIRRWLRRYLALLIIHVSENVCSCFPLRQKEGGED